MQVSRKAGAFRRRTRCGGVLLALLLAAAGQALHAAELRLLHADPTAVRQSRLPAAGVGLDPTLLLQFDTGGERHALRLQPNTRLVAALARLPPATEAFQGRVEGIANSWAAITRIGSRWSGVWYDGAEYFGVDAVASLGDAATAGTVDAGALDAGALVVYRLRDLVWDEEPSLDGDVQPAPESAVQLASLPLAALLPDDEPSKELAIGVVADALLERREGDELEANLLAQLNVIDGVFASQIGVHITAASITIFKSRSSQPFSNTTDAEDLLDELSDWRGRTAAQRQLGLTHLFTGRDLDGRTVGMAYLGTLCNRSFSASLSQSTGPVSFTALVAAHEIAHVFGAPHDGDEARACAAAPAGYLMSPRISGNQEFSSCSIEQMAPRVQQAACLTPLPVGGESPEEPVEPGTQGGSGTLPVSSLLLLGLFAAAGVRRQMRANQSAR